MPPTLVNELVYTACDPMFVNEIGDCVWDSATKTLTTPRDAQMEADNAHENAGFYIDIDKLLISGKGKRDSGRQNQRKATSEQLRRLNDAASFTTLNVNEDDDAGGKGYSGDTGAPAFSLGRIKASGEAIDGNGNGKVTKSNESNKDDGVSALSGTSGVSSSRREVAKLERELAEARAAIEAMKALSEPRSTARRKGSGSSSVESLGSSSSSSSDSTHDDSSSPASSSLGSNESRPSVDDDL